MIKKNLNELLNKLKLEKDNIRIFGFAVIMTTLAFGGYYLFGNYFVSIIGIINMLIFSLVLLIFMSLAAYTVLKTLFIVAAELSLLIFLSQSYCDIPNRSITGDGSLKFLLVIGIAYIIINFFYCFYRIIKKHNKNEKGKLFTREVGFLGVIIFFAFVGLFIWQVYQVVFPIITNLCIYK
jgi:hypothetical protein